MGSSSPLSSVHALEELSSTDRDGARLGEHPESESPANREGRMPEKPRLDKSAEWTGHWWLPEDPEAAVPGILRYDPVEGLRLDLIGGFEDRILRAVAEGVVVMQGSKAWPAIVGIADNKEVTLIDCWPSHSKTYALCFHGPHKQTIRAMTGLIGVHLTDVEQPVFTELRVSVENLGHWSNSSVFGGTMVLRTTGSTGPAASASARSRSRPRSWMEPRSPLRTNTPCPTSTDVAERLSAGCGTPYSSGFQPESPYSLTSARDHARAIQDLLPLTARASGTPWMQLRVPREGEELPDW